jgi:putative spermidine/putrescine transport system ATP-binding protein
MKAQIDIDQLTKSFAEVVAVDDATLTIHPGEFFTILGPSGSGKSTLLMLLAGFLEATKGDIRIDGRSVVGLPPHKRSFGVVFQQYALFPNMNVRRNVAFPLEERRLPREEIKKKVEETLRLVELDGFADRKIDELSGGQQQRVALARALVFDPPLLLMDEPLSALDRRLRETMQLELQRLHRRLGVTVIYVTHDQGEALTLSDRVAVMRDGRIVQVASPRELYEQPVDSFVASFLGESNLLPATVSAIHDGHVELEGGDGLSVTCPVPSVSPEVGEDVMLVVRPEHVELAISRDALTADSAGEPGFTASGLIAEVTYLGETTRYVADCRGRRIIARRQNDVGVPLFGVGDPVTVSWPSHAAQICR